MDKYTEANRRGWAALAADHYETYRDRLRQADTTLAGTQIKELGDIRGKRVVHLQCNVGADTVSLARLGASVTGVDLVPDNIRFARKLAADFGIVDAVFIESDVLDLINTHHEKYDVVFTTEGVLCWIRDLDLWAQNVRHVLADDGFLYLLDGHPFYMVWDEARLPDLVVKYPYFHEDVERDTAIGGYASEPKEAEHFTWMYTMGGIVTALSGAGLHIDWLHEYDWAYTRDSDTQHYSEETGGYQFPELRGKLPFTFSLRASVR